MMGLLIHSISLLCPKPLHNWDFSVITCEKLGEISHIYLLLHSSFVMSNEPCISVISPLVFLVPGISTSFLNVI